MHDSVIWTLKKERQHRDAGNQESVVVSLKIYIFDGSRRVQEEVIAAANGDLCAIPSIS